MHHKRLIETLDVFKLCINSLGAIKWYRLIETLDVFK